MLIRPSQGGWTTSGLQVLTHSFRKSSPDPGLLQPPSICSFWRRGFTGWQFPSAGQPSPWWKRKAVQMKSENPEPEESQSRILRHLVPPSTEPLYVPGIDKKGDTETAVHKPIRVFAWSLLPYWLSGSPPGNMQLWSWLACVPFDGSDPRICSAVI